ncbi:MAG: Rrf2 family transcriptional regulator [Gammaproteobacteria bacterium]|nr:Rrf2 family transcriptional regulator [Gammaproteobacteria bacterium]
MRIAACTDYSLRVLMFLALREGEMATIREIAAAFGISHNHLMKVTHRMHRQGLIQTARGKAGGMSLARPASEIRVGEVLRAMEPDWRLVECFGADNGCAITASCRLKGVLAGAMQSFWAALDACTIAELVGGPGPALCRDLGLARAAGRRPVRHAPPARLDVEQ